MARRGGQETASLVILAGVEYNPHGGPLVSGGAWENRSMHWNDLLGKHIGPYEVIEELGRGGTARVYRAYQESKKRHVALKVMANESEDRAGFVRRFEREVAAVAQLDHPNIVAVYDSGEYEDLVYLVMQCVTGGTLRQRLGEPLSVPDACVAMIQMARALHHAHLHGIVHRDVKPSNMLIDTEANDKLLLTDFGIARLHGLRGLTKTGTTVGTPEYMAPEQAEGREIDARVDVYSLGCVLYETLAGRPPFTGSAPVSVLYQQVHSRPSYIRGFNPGVPRELAHVIDVALAKRPEERFPTTDALAHALHPFTEGRDRVSFGAGAAVRPVMVSGPREPGASGSPLASPAVAAGELDLRTRPEPGAAADVEARGRHAAGNAGMNIPPLARPVPDEYGATPPPTDAHGRGLGAEGLDAIFPDDPEAAESERERLAARESSELARDFVSGRLTGTPAGGADYARGGPTPWRILAPQDQYATQPGTSGGLMDSPLIGPGATPAEPSGGALSIPLTPTGQLDLDALMTAVDSESAGAWEEGWTNPSVTAYGGPGGWPALGPGPEVPEGAHGDPNGITDSGAFWRPDALELPPDEPRRRTGRRKARNGKAQKGKARKGRRRASVLAVVALCAVILGTYAAVSISGIGLGLAGRTGHSATPTATSLPTATATPEATATTGPTPQQVLDQEARAAFRAITLMPRPDPTCAARASTKTYTRTQYVYLDLCEAKSAPGSGRLSVELFRGDGSVVYNMATDQLTSPGSAHQFDVFNLVPGAYYFLVTFNSGVAANLAFTVTH